MSNFNLNMANRKCANVEIREYATKKPVMHIDFCNTTTAGFDGNTVYAKRQGADSIAFYDSIKGTMSMSFQEHPFKVYSLLSDGSIEHEAVVPVREKIVCKTAGSLDLSDTPISGTTFVYNKNDYGGENDIKGTVSDDTFTSTSDSDLTVDTEYIVGYLVSKTNVNKVSFNNSKIPQAYYLTQETLDKNTEGVLVPVKVTAYKATPQRKLDLSFSSEGEPATITITFDCAVDDDDNCLDMIEILDEA